MCIPQKKNYIREMQSSGNVTLFLLGKQYTIGRLSNNSFLDTQHYYLYIEYLICSSFSTKLNVST